MRHVPLLLPFLLALGGCQVILFPFAPPDVPELRVEEARFERGFHDHVRVVVSTATNLGDYWRRHRGHTGFDVSRCRNGRADPRRLVNTGAMRTRDGRFQLEEFDELNPEPAPPPDPDGRFRYSFHVAVRNDFQFRDPTPPAARASFVLHDLTRDAVDLCFIVRGGSMVGAFSSPSVVLPYALIADALARAGLPHAAPAPPGPALP